MLVVFEGGNLVGSKRKAKKNNKKNEKFVDYSDKKEVLSEVSEDKIEEEISEVSEDKIEEEISEVSEDKIEQEVSEVLEDKIEEEVSEISEDKIEEEVSEVSEDKIEEEASEVSEEKKEDVENSEDIKEKNIEKVLKKNDKYNEELEKRKYAKEIREEKKSQRKNKNKKVHFMKRDSGFIKTEDIYKTESKKIESNTKKGVFIFAAIMLIFLGSVFLFKQTNNENTIVLDKPTKEYIARLNVEGVISKGVETDFLGNALGYDHVWILNQIDELIEDKNNVGLIIYVDSPGGSVYESDELYLKIQEYKDKTARPVYVAMGNVAASGGYYISVAADKIYANRNTITGSIGVRIGPFYDLTGLMEKYGVKSKIITSGSNKAMGDFTEQMTEEQEKIFQSIVNEAYEQFLQVVLDGRNMKAKKLWSIADGRVYTAMQALGFELVDDIGTYADALYDMKEEYELENAEEFDLDKTKVHTFFGIEIKSPFLKKGLPESDLSILNKMMKENQNFSINYIM